MDCCDQTPRQGLGPLVEHLSTAVAALIDGCEPEHLSSVPGEDLGEASVLVGNEISRMGSAQAALVSAWDTSKAWADDGSRSAAAAFSSKSGCSTAAGRRLARRARKLRNMPATAAAWRAGEISEEAVDVLCGLVNERTAELFRRDEESLLEAARNLGHRDFTRAAAYWASCADDATAEDEVERSRARRGVSWTRDSEGVTEMVARLEAVGGAAVLGELERLERHLFELDWAEAKQRLGDSVTVDQLQRTTTQRRADALVLMAERSAAAEPDAANAPLISVLIDAATFARATDLLDVSNRAGAGDPDGADHAAGGANIDASQPTDESRGDRIDGSAADDGSLGADLEPDPAAGAGTTDTTMHGPTEPTDHTTDEADPPPWPGTSPTSPGRRPDWTRSDWQRRIAELADGTPLTDSQIRRIAVNSHVERVVIAPGSRIIDVGRRRRFYTGAARRAIEIRDRHCTHPTCDEPAHRCHADHIVPHAYDGPTDLANGRLLCPEHNRGRGDHPPRPPTPP